MSYQEALAWLEGRRSTTNTIPESPEETWLVRIAEADAAMCKQAYYITKATEDGLLDSDRALSAKEPDMEADRDQLRERVRELERASKAIHDDLLDRAEIDPDDGGKIVDVSSGVWLQLKDALGCFEITEDAEVVCREMNKLEDKQ